MKGSGQPYKKMIYQPNYLKDSDTGTLFFCNCYQLYERQVNCCFI